MSQSAQFLIPLKGSLFVFLQTPVKILHSYLRVSRPEADITKAHFTTSLYY